MHSIGAFLAVAAVVTLTPGPAFALLVQTALIHGRRVALANIAGNSIGVLIWGGLSALGVSALVAANEIAYDVLRISGAIFLIGLGIRSVLARPATDGPVVNPTPAPGRRALRRGLVNALANPKLAIFFVALLPQFLTRDSAQLPIALAMAGAVVACDVIWFGTVAIVVDAVRTSFGPRLVTRLERFSGTVLVGLGLRLATEAR